MIVVLGLNHRSSPVEVRERFAFEEAAIPAALGRLLESEGFSEAVILSTCNRVEIYAVSSLEASAAFAALKSFLTSREAGGLAPQDEFYALAEPQSVEHLFRVACGLDSMVLGETEILGQLKNAYEISRARAHTAARLNKAFQRAFHVAKHVRTETNIQRGSVSVASVAVELAEKIFASLRGRQVMVLGAGDTSEKTARALLSRGAGSLLVANRTFGRAAELAAELGGRAVPFDHWGREFEKTDIVISSTAAPHPILDRATLEPAMKSRKNRPLLLVDIAVPRDIDPEVNRMPNVYLYNIDDLRTIADGYLLQRKEEIARCEKIIAEKVRALLGSGGGEFSPGGQPVFGR
jgi:glutamyl-tRNA reductase